MKRRNDALTIVLSCVALVGCPSGPGPGTHTGPITFDEFVSGVSRVDCDYFLRCDANDALLGLILRSTIADCPAQFEQYLDEQAYARYREAIAAGTIVFHGDVAAQCLDAFDTATCPGIGSTYYDVCIAVFEGRVPDGGSCTLATECASGGTCAGASGTTCGTCSPAAHEGEACSATLACATGTYCASGTCRTPGGAGAACDPSASSSTACQTGLGCVASAGDPTMGTCTALSPPTLGMPCTFSTPCATGLVCGTSGGESTCRQPRTDGTCQATYLGASDCGAGTVCSIPAGSADGTCVAIPTLGQACSSICVSPARCVGGMCVATRHVGESCASADECLSASCTSGTCTIPLLCSP